MLALMSRHKNSETAIARSSYNFIGPLSSLTIWKHKFEIYGPEGNPENSPMLWKRLFHRRILALAIAKVLEDKFPNRNNVAVNTKTSHDIVNLVDANLSSYYDSQVGWTEWQYCTVDERGRDKNNIRTRDRLEGRKTVQGQDLRIVLSPIYRKSLDVFVQRCIAGPDIDFRVPKPTIFDFPGNMGQQLNPWITSGPMDKPTSKSSPGWYPIHLRNEVSVRVSEESRYLHLEYDAVTMVKKDTNLGHIFWDWFDDIVKEDNVKEHLQTLRKTFVGLWIKRSYGHSTRKEKSEAEWTVMFQMHDVEFCNANMNLDKGKNVYGYLKTSGFSIYFTCRPCFVLTIR
jgi:hypothetical protein